MHRLICFPHAGGSASAFRPWRAVMPPDVTLHVMQYPGRESRFGEPLIDRMPDLARLLTDELMSQGIRRPYVLLGHSMGAAVAYEVAQELRRRGQPGPDLLVPCARQSPAEPRRGEVHRGDDDVLLAELRRLGGTPSEVLADPDLRRTVLRVVRNDYRLSETYVAQPAPPLECPIMVLVGDADPECSAADGAGWAAVTTGHTTVSTFSGDHFFLTPRRREIVTAVLSRLGLPAVNAWPSTP